MRIAYYDEAGDDGFPSYSSPLFALSAVYMHYLQWQPNFERGQGFRRSPSKDLPPLRRNTSVPRPRLCLGPVGSKAALRRPKPESGCYRLADPDRS